MEEFLSCGSFVGDQCSDYDAQIAATALDGNPLEFTEERLKVKKKNGLETSLFLEFLKNSSMQWDSDVKIYLKRPSNLDPVKMQRLKTVQKQNRCKLKGCEAQLLRGVAPRLHRAQALAFGLFILAHLLQPFKGVSPWFCSILWVEKF